MNSARPWLRSVLLVSWLGFMPPVTLRAGDIIRINLDGSHPVNLVSNISGSLVELDLDLAHQKMYWMTSVGIFDANLKGSNVRELLPVGPLGSLGKADMILTPNLIVWTEDGNIFRSNLNGSDKQQIFQASSTAGAATSLAYDSVTGLLYWYGRSDPNSVNDGHGIVRTMNLDGSNRKALIDSGLPTITYGFALSDSLNRMYLAGHMSMRLASVDGSGLTTLPLTPFYPGTIRIDEGKSRIYYRDDVDYQGILSANLDGTNVDDVYRGPVSGFQLDTQDNAIFLLGSGGTVPEPSTLLMVTTGLLASIGYHVLRRGISRSRA